MIDARALATAQLTSGERLLWVGTSDPRVVFTGRDVFLVPFSLLWCGFAVYWLVGASADGAPVFFPIFGSVFVLFGLHFVFGRFLVKRHRKLTQAYAVTDRRAFVTNGRSTQETSVGRTDRTVRWSRGRQHCSVEWETRNGGGFFGGGMNRQIYANTGLDGLAGPAPMAFWDVHDGDGLMRALDQAVTLQR